MRSEQRRWVCWRSGVMEVTWFCRIRDKQYGPYRWAQLQQLAARGGLTAHSLVRRVDEQTWIEARNVKGLLPSELGGPPPPPPPDKAAAGLSSATAGESVEVASVIQVDELAEPIADSPPIQATGLARPGQMVIAKPLPAEPPALPTVRRSAKPGVASPSKATNPSVPSLPVGIPVVASKEQRRKAARQKLLLMVGGTLAATLIIAAIGVAIAWRNERTGVLNAGDASAAASSNTENKPAAGESTVMPSGAEAADSASNKPDGAAPRAFSTPTVETGKDAPRDKAVDAVLRSITRWRDASTVSGVSTGTARLQITGAWLTDGKATKEDGEAADETDRATGAPKPDAAAAKRPALCVEVRVTCLAHAESAITYNSWNLTGSGGSHPSVLLVDQANRPYELISVEKWADRDRQATPKKLQPGQAITDLLVFPIPADGDFEFVRLALKMSALSQGDRYLGFQFARDQIASTKPESIADDPPAARATATDAPTAAAPEEAKPEPATKAAAPAVPAENDIEQLKRQIEASAKAAREAREKERKEEDRRNQGKDN